MTPMTGILETVVIKALTYMYERGAFQGYSSERKDRQYGKLNGVAQIQKITTGAGKRLEHPTPVHKTKSVWLYATHPSMRSPKQPRH